MLSERQLARGYAAAWQQWTPHLDASFLASLRPDGAWAHATSAWAPPLQAQAPARHNDVVAEIAFGLLCAGLEDAAFPIERLPANEVEGVVADALSRLALLRRSEGLPREAVGTPHLEDAYALALRLRDHLRGFPGTTRVHERLEGSGLLAACHPDVMQDDVIVEVKMSQVSFRSADLRQLLVYAAMAHWNHQPARELALVNPRLGLTWRFDVEALVQRVSDSTPASLYRSIERFVSEEAWGA